MTKRNGIVQIFDAKYFIFNGKHEGEYKKYHYVHKTLLILCSYMKNDKKEGEYKYYHANGQLNLIYNYRDGKIEGICKIYYKNGQLIQALDYKNGKICTIYYYEMNN
jgi:antitoxin component YwqK of YwqJK toxin-antitoxin module